MYTCPFLNFSRFSASFKPSLSLRPVTSTRLASFTLDLTAATRMLLFFNLSTTALVSAFPSPASLNIVDHGTTSFPVSSSERPPSNPGNTDVFDPISTSTNSDRLGAAVFCVKIHNSIELHQINNNAVRIIKTQTVHGLAFAL